MSLHGVEGLNEVQNSSLFRDTLLTAIIAVCRQIFTFSNFIRIDGKISFIVDDLQVMSMSLSEIVGNQTSPNHIGSEMLGEKLSSKLQFDGTSMYKLHSNVSPLTQTKCGTGILPGKKSRCAPARAKKLVFNMSGEDTETIRDSDTFETCVSSVCDSSSAVNLESQYNNSDVGDAHQSCSSCEVADTIVRRLRRQQKQPNKLKKCGMHSGRQDKLCLDPIDSAVHSCQFCEEIFHAASSLRKHVRDTHKDKPKMKCNFCRLRFLTSDSLKQHVESKHQYRCTICSTIFSSSRLLHEHSNNVHAEKMLSCVICNRLFTTRGSLQRHMIGHSEVTRPRVSCDGCEKSFTSASTLYHHKRAIHGTEKPYRCQECGEHFNFNHSLKLHLLKHAGIRPYQCTMCGKSYLTASHLKYHIEAIHSAVNKFICNICGKSFPYETSFKLHSMLHSDDRPFTCCTCGKRYITRGALREHEVTHVRGSDDHQQYRCEVCSQLYRTAALLRAHSRRHTADAARHVCEVCGRTFMYRSNLDSHATVHSGERAFACNICGKKFKTSATLYTHSIIHKTDIVANYVCITCGKPFKTKERLKAHEARHSGAKLFKCRVCGGNFPDRGGLNKHVKTVHSTKPRFGCPECGKTANRLDNLRVHMRTHNKTSLLTMTAAELSSELASLNKSSSTASGGASLFLTSDNKSCGSTIDENVLSCATIAGKEITISNIPAIQGIKTCKEDDIETSYKLMYDDVMN